MDVLPPAFEALAEFPQFIVYICKPRNGHEGKMDKIPVDYRTGHYPVNPLNPEIWTDVDTAIKAAKNFGEGYCVGFVLTEQDPFWFLDVDDCITQIDGKATLSPLANVFVTVFSDAAREISSSGKGLHFIAKGTVPKHDKRKALLNIELYTENRFIALTGIEATGDAGLDFSVVMPWMVDNYFSPILADLAVDGEWTIEAYEGWSGICDDDKLMEVATNTKSGGAVFGGKASFQSLWYADAGELSKFYKPSNPNDVYNRSSADLALACHLAYWTGENCERIKQLMLKSGLVREKWQREKYIQDTILKACALQKKSRQDKVSQQETNVLKQIINPAEQPESLPELPSVLSFDYSYLPSSLRDYVRDIAERMQCPPDFPAVATFVMMATICGRKIGLRPMKNNDWTVIPNLWSAVIGNSGVMKSPALNETLSPLKKLATNEYQIFNKAYDEYCMQEKIAKMQESINEKDAKKALKQKKVSEVRELLKLSEGDNKPILKRYITNNSSYEALGELLIENHNGLLVEGDEIIGLLKQLDASGQESARSFYLTAADGDKSYTFDRIKRGKGLHIEAVCISIIGGIQPGVLAEYVRQAVNGGANSDGLMQRFALMVYPDISPHWKEVDRRPNSIARHVVNTMVEKLNCLNCADIGAEKDAYGGVPFLRFDDAAQILFSKWRAELEHRLRSGEEHPAIVSHLSKYRKLIPSLALLNHLCDSGRGSVTEEALQRAIDYSKYLESHARRVYSFATRPDIDAAKTLLKRLMKGKLLSPFTARDVYKKDWAGLAAPNKAKAAIAVLIEYGHLTEEPRQTNGKSTTFYHWISSSC